MPRRFLPTFIVFSVMSLLLGFWLPGLLAGGQSAQPAASGPVTDTNGWFSLALPWDDAAPSRIDASDLLRLPNDPAIDASGPEGLAPLIDARGFVTTSPDGHFILSNSGDRIRFWGTNLTFSAAFPPCPAYPPGGEFQDADAAEKLAARLASLGFDAVRLHHIDWFSRPSGLWQDYWQNTQAMDPVQLGRLDCLIYQLKRHGIYVDLNLHVSRNFVAGDGVTAAAEFADASYNKGATLFDPLMIALQRQYAGQLLNHVNPYTGLAYKDEPAIFTTETTNEDSLFLSLTFDQLIHDPAATESLPAFYSQELDGWTQAAGRGPSINRLSNPGFEAGLEGWYSYVDGPAQAAFAPDPAQSAEGSQSLRVAISQPGDESWQVQFGQSQLALLAGQRYRLRFAVRADQPASVTGNVMRDADPWDALGWRDEIAVTTQWVTHTVKFTATETIFGGAQITFDVGGAARTLWFDDFLFQEVDAFPGWLGWLEAKYGSTAALAAAWAPTDAVSETEMLDNGSFEQGTVEWSTYVDGAASASFNIDSSTASAGSRSMRIGVTQADSADWHVKISQGGLAMVGGQRYRISFDAKASQPGAFGFHVMQNHDPYGGLGLWGSAEPGADWQHFEAVFMAEADDANAMAGFDLGQAVRTIWIDNVSLKPVNPRGLLPGESLEANNVARLNRDDFAGYTRQRVHDLLQFYEETEAGYFAAMRDFIQDDLGSQNLNTGTASYIDSLPDFYAMAGLDFVDNHIYWDHPSWPNVPAWSETGWVIENQAWVNDPFAGLFDKAVTAVEGQPFTLTEFNEVFPNRHAAEGFLLMATFANLQDWDGVFQFAYSHDQNNYDAEEVTGFFDLAGNSLMTGLMPVASRLFLAGQTAPAPAESGLAFAQDERYDSVNVGWGGSSAEYLEQVKGVDPAAAFGSRLRISDFAAQAPVTPTLPTPAGPVYVSGGGELAWDISDAERGFYTFDAPLAQGALGFLASRTVSLSNLELRTPAGGAEFAAVAWQSRDGRPLAASGETLLSIFTRVENSGQVWNAEETSLDDRWGGPPALIEPISLTATLTISDPAGVEVWALDAMGKRHHVVASQVSGPEELTLALDTAEDQTLWYALLRQAARCDVDDNGDVRVVDVQRVAAAFDQASPPAPAVLDLTADGFVDLQDVMVAAGCWHNR